jgi:hypothetical protein
VVLKTDNPPVKVIGMYRDVENIIIGPVFYYVALIEYQAEGLGY